MSRSNNQNDDLFMDALSDCSEDNDAQINDDGPENDGLNVLTFQISDSNDASDDTNEDITVNTAYDWSENDTRFQLEAYHRNSGVNVMPQNRENIWEIVQLFLGNDLLELFVTETNRYRSQVVSKHKEYKAVKWIDVTVNEMKKFLGLIILMGQIRKDDIYDYWSTLLYIETPIFSKTMSRNRFMQIWRMWHFCNNDLLADKSDKLFKIREVVNYFQNKFQTVFTPKQELALDENIIPSRGSLAFRTYNPERQVKYGILVRMLCEATSGYVCNFQIYSGPETLQDTILSIVDPYVGFYHHIYMDNNYTSVPLAELLLRKKTRICGPIRVNRGFPPSLKNINLKENQTKFARKGQILLQLWQPKKAETIRMISTIHSAEMVNVSHRPREKTKPKSIVEYNKYKKVADRVDQYMSYYNILRKNTKWTKKAVLYLLNAALFNAFLIYKRLNNNNKMIYKKFLRQVAIALIDTPGIENVDSEEAGPSNPVEITKRTPRNDPPERLSQDFKKHKLIPIVTGGKKQYPHRRCRVCSAAKKNGYTRYICDFCKVPLHKLKCFERYHTLKRY